MALVVLGLQHGQRVGLGSAATLGSIVAGVVLRAAFVRFELRVANPLLDLRIFSHRGFSADNAVLFSKSSLGVSGAIAVLAAGTIAL
jgi:hypothetical protein